MDLTVSFPMGSYSGATKDPTRLAETELAAQTPTATITGGVATAVAMGGSPKVCAKFTPSVVTPTGGATQYRIAINLPQARPPA